MVSLSYLVLEMTRMMSVNDRHDEHHWAKNGKAKKVRRLMALPDIAFDEVHIFTEEESCILFKGRCVV